MKRRTIKSILVMLLACLMLFFVGSCSTANVEIGRDGSGTATITIAKGEGISENTIRDEMRDMFELVGIASDGDEHRLKMESLVEAENCYIVEISFKRIQYVKGIGSFGYQDASDYLEDNNATNGLKNWGKGEYGTFQSYTDTIYTFKKNSDLAFDPVHVETGAKVLINPTETQREKGAKGFLDKDGLLSEHKRGKMFTFFMADIEGLESVTFSFKGDVIAYGGQNVEVVDDSTIKVTPTSITANVKGLDENGNPFIENRDVQCFVGCVYVALEFNPVLLWGLIIGGSLLLLLLVIWIARGGFKKFRKSPKTKAFFRNYDLYIMMLPTIILLGLFMYAPMSGIIMAFKNYRIQDGMFGSEWAAYGGFKNFYGLFTNPAVDFWRLVGNTFMLALLRFIFGFVCAVFLALLFSYLKDGRFKKWVQTISYFPYFISWLTISGIAYLFLGTDGILNDLITMFGGDKVSFYSEPKYWRTILTFTYIWKTLGYSTIVYLAAITAINPALYEAARIDGAGRMGQLWHITLPGLFPVIGVQIIFSLGNLVKDDIDQIYTMTQGGATALRDTTEVLGMVVYKQRGNASAYSSTTAMGLMQGLAALILVSISNRIVKKLGVDGAY
ncbi:MAG: sugar ABC transporter permease [Clostridiales bacterium]|nr:sugar ABC transporter permease [Clostridiales bacterium]